MMTNWKLEIIRRSRVYTPASQVEKILLRKKNQLPLETTSDNKKTETRIVISKKNRGVVDNPPRGGYVADIKIDNMPKLNNCGAFSVSGDGDRSCGSLC